MFAAIGTRPYSTPTGRLQEAAPFFVECVRAAMRAGLDAAIEADIDVLVLARLSGGIYAGAFRSEMTQPFYGQLLRELLAEDIEVQMVEEVEESASKRRRDENRYSSSSSSSATPSSMRALIMKRGACFTRVIMPWV